MRDILDRLKGYRVTTHMNGTKPIKEADWSDAISEIEHLKQKVIVLEAEITKWKETAALQTQQREYPCSPHCAGYLREQAIMAKLQVFLNDRV